MREELLTYYERELTFLRQMGAEFAEKYPKIASRLLLEPDRCEDPHVERMLEAFAFLAARVHLKVDDDFPEITESLLGILYPHYTRPIPSMSVVEFHLDPEQGKLSTGLTLPRGLTLYSSEVEGVPCKFQSCYETTLWPVTVNEVLWRTPDRLQPPLKAPEAVAAIRVLLKCAPDVSFGQLDLKSLRFFLNGESNLVSSLYEVLCNNCTEIVLREPGARAGKEPVVLPASALRPVGFAPEEAVIPYSRRSFEGFRVLQEYFSFPDKFFFLELKGLDRLAQAGFKDAVEVLFLISHFERPERQEMLEVGVTTSTLRLNCSPINNLFPQTAEPILLDQTRYEYPVVPDVRRQFATEIFSIDDVVCTNPNTQEVVRFEPFYAFRHGAAAKRDKKHCFWHATRRSAGVRDEQRTTMFLSIVDPSGRPTQPESDALTVRCTCTNYTLPSRLPFGDENGDFQVEGFSAIKKIVSLRKPTPTVHAQTGKGAQWRLISHLSLNYLSLVEEGKEALQQILQLYNFSDSPHLQNQIAGITSLRSRRDFARLVSEHGVSAARGTRVELQFDEEQFVGGGVYLFASVLEHFLGTYVSMNSFSQLSASTVQRKEVLKEWPPRAGRSILL